MRIHYIQIYDRQAKAQQHLKKSFMAVQELKRSDLFRMHDDGTPMSLYVVNDDYFMHGG